MRLLLTMMLLMTTGLAHAQTLDVVAKYNGEGIDVRWFPPPPETDNQTSRYRIERTDSTGRVLSITHKPLSPITNLATIRSKLGPFSATYEAAVLSAAREQSFSMVSLNRALRSSAVGDLIAWFAVTYPEVAEVLGQRRVDIDVQPGASYAYRVYMDRGDGAGEVLLGSAKASAKPSALGAPRTVTVRQRAPDRLEVNWVRDAAREAREAVVRYIVYRKRSGGRWIALNTGIASPAMAHHNQKPSQDGRTIDRDVVIGARYQYAVSSVDITGMESSKTSSAVVMVQDQVAPPPPVDVSSTMDMDGMSISWSAAGLPEDAKSFEVVALKREDNAGMERKVLRVLATVPRNKAVWSTRRPAPGVHEYAVRTVDTSGNRGPLSRVITRHIERPLDLQSPKGLRLKLTEEGVLLSWKGVRRGDVVGYIIERRHASEPTEAATQLMAKPITETTWLDQQAPISGASIAYRVIGVDPAGHRSPPSAWSRVADTRAAERVTIQDLKDSPGGVIIRWTADEASRVDARIVEVSVNNGPFKPLKFGRVSPSVREVIDGSDYPPESLLIYRVVSQGVDGAAAQISGTRLLQTRPQSIGSIAPPRLQCVRGAVEVSWERTEGADRVEIQRADGQQSFVVRRAVKGTSWRDLHTREGRTYTYRLRPLNGHQHGAISDAVEVTCDVAKP